MPIYEFKCQDCNARTSVFVRTVSSEVKGNCSSCGGDRLERLISRCGIVRSVKSVHDKFSNLDDPEYFNDPRNIGRRVEDNFAQMGMDMPSDLRETIDAARDGIVPDSVKDLQPNVTEF